MEGPRRWEAGKWVTYCTIWPAAVQKGTWLSPVSSSPLCLFEVPNARFKPRTDFENIFLLLFCQTCSLAYYVRAGSAKALQSLLFLQADLACTIQTLDPHSGTEAFSRDSTKWVLISRQVILFKWETVLLSFNCYFFIYGTSFLAVFCWSLFGYIFSFHNLSNYKEKSKCSASLLLTRERNESVTALLS